MSSFAVINNNEIINIIEADSLLIAESVTEKTCVLIEEDLDVGIGYIWSNEYNKYMPKQPYESWIYNIEKKSWIPPTEMPIDSNQYVWNESTKKWNKVK